MAKAFSASTIQAASSNYDEPPAYKLLIMEGYIHSQCENVKQ
jgi:hypothetical protein